MGENRWRAESDWPLARTHYTKWYLHSGGSANTLEGDGTLSTSPPAEEPFDVYSYDPADPVQTRGGSTLIIPQGVADQREVESREDVLVYTSGPLLRNAASVSAATPDWTCAWTATVRWTPMSW